MRRPSARRRCRTGGNRKKLSVDLRRRQMHLNVEGRRRLDLPSTAVGAVGGALGTYFLDPRRGRARRRMVRDRSFGAVRHSWRHTLHGAHVKAAFARGHARGLAHRLRHAPPRELDDATLAHKVESIVFRDHRIPKGKINVNAESGAVFLRGELESPELIEDLVRAVRAVPGVHDVENLLHLEGAPPPIM